MSGSEEFFGKVSSGDGYPAVAFETVGDYVKGVIIEDPTPVKRQSLKEGVGLEDQLPVNIKIDGPTKVRIEGEIKNFESGQDVTLWIGPHGFLASAVKAAMNDVGVKGLAGGGNITIALIEKRDTGKPKPANIYRVAYTPPVSSGTSVADLFPDAKVAS